MVANKWFVLLLIVALVVSEVDAKKKNKKRKNKGNNGWGNNKMSQNQFLANGPFFSIPVVVGSDKTMLNVGIDGYYGASLIFGKGVACDGSDSYCVPHDTFDHMASSTFTVHREARDFNLSLGVVSGLAGSDDLKIGTLKLKDTMFGVAKSIPRHLNRKAKVSGFLAMNAPVDSEDDKTTMQKVADQAAKPTITFYAPTDMNGQHAVTIGSEDTTHCKNNWMKFPNQPSVDPGSLPWTINFQGFNWGSHSCTEKMNVALSPAADYFVAPRRHSEYFKQKLNAKHSSSYSGLMVDCSKINSAPNLEFNVPGGKKLIVTPKQYIKMFDSRNCLLNIYPDELNQWTLPYMFFQRYCVKFDYGMKEVSIADQM